ncbi:MAG: uncharacterized protein A8A55_3125 [Amphiamblys sp. WSBS2006]|nr:MAG: uncharacterized protein A8A55_3125 [Amphiamblys sp. WSBS2006]
MAHMEQNGAITEDMIGWKMEYLGDLLVLTKQDADERKEKRYMGEEFAFRESVFLRDRIKDGKDPRCVYCGCRLPMLQKNPPNEGGEGKSLSEREDVEEDNSSSEREDAESECIGEECFISPLCDDFHAFICLECFKTFSIESKGKLECEWCHTYRCTWLSADEVALVQLLGMAAERRTVAGRRTISFKKGGSVLFNHSYISVDAFKALLDWVDMEIEEELSVVWEKNTDISFTQAQRGKLMELEEDFERLMTLVSLIAIRLVKRFDAHIPFSFSIHSAQRYSCYT